MSERGRAVGVEGRTIGAGPASPARSEGPEPRTAALAAAFDEAGTAHHRAYAATDGADPEWPIWYAEHLHATLGGLLGATFTRSELVRLLLEAETERAARAPGAPWPRWYARFFLERYGG